MWRRRRELRHGRHRWHGADGNVVWRLATTGSAGAGDSEVVVGAVLEPTSLNLITQAGAALDQVLLDNVYETLLTATARR